MKTVSASRDEPEIPSQEGLMANFKFMNKIKKVLQDNNFELFSEDVNSIKEEENFTLKGKTVVDGEEIIAVVVYTKTKSKIDIGFDFEIKVHFESFHYYQGNFVLIAEDENEMIQQLEENFEKNFISSFEDVKKEHERSKSTQPTTAEEAEEYFAKEEAEALQKHFADQDKARERLFKGLKELEENNINDDEKMTPSKFLSCINMFYKIDENSDSIRYESDEGHEGIIDFSYEHLYTTAPFGSVSFKTLDELKDFRRKVRAKML